MIDLQEFESICIILLFTKNFRQLNIEIIVHNLYKCNFHPLLLSNNFGFYRWKTKDELYLWTRFAWNVWTVKTQIGNFAADSVPLSGTDLLSLWAPCIRMMSLPLCLVATNVSRCVLIKLFIFAKWQIIQDDCSDSDYFKYNFNKN